MPVLSASLKIQPIAAATLGISPVIAVGNLQSRVIRWRINEGDRVMVNAGIGYHDIIIDISQSVALLPSALIRAEMIIIDPDEAETIYEAPAPAIATILATPDPQLYTVDVVVACEDETHTYFQLRHNFAKRGTYLVGVRFYYGSIGEWISTTEALVVKAGDGLYGGCY